MSDEIPVGSPPAPPGRHAAPGGWYADPVDPGQERYWDGWQWSRTVRPRPGARGGTPPQGEPGAFGAAADQQAPQSPEPTGSGPGFGQAGYGRPLYRMVPATADGVPLSGWWWRVLAYLIDFFLVSAVVQIIARIVGWQAEIDRAMNQYTAYLTEVLTTGGELDFLRAMELASPPESTYVNITTMVVFVVYSALMLRSRGATLGKLVCRLRVVPLDEGRSTPGLPTRMAWSRPLALTLMGLVPLLQLVDFMFPLWDRRRQALHDKVGRTQVIRESRRP